MTARCARLPRSVAAALGAAAIAGASPAGATIYTSYAAWSSAIGGTDAKIDFNIGTPALLAEQYAWMGVHFEPGQASVVHDFSAPDGWLALATPFGGNKFVVNYDTPQSSLGFDLLALFSVSLYLGDSLVYQSSQINSGTPVFRGLVLTETFDHAVIQGLAGPLPRLDNLYVGTPIPAPAAGAALLAGLLAGGRRRR